MHLPRELRHRIYGYALCADVAITPQLCYISVDNNVKFHNKAKDCFEHNSVNQLLGVTRASKQLRAESLPVFYSTNTFFVYDDTMTYFSRLEYLGRLHMIRQVRFSVNLVGEDKVPDILRRMHIYIKEADAFEQQLTQHVGARAETLRAHPQYTYCGIPHLNVFITLSKLASKFSSTSTTTTAATTATTTVGQSSSTSPLPHSRLVLPLPDPSVLTTNSRLTYFPLTLSCLGIDLQTVSNQNYNNNMATILHLSHLFAKVSLELTWLRRFQKNDLSPPQPYVSPVDAQGETIASRSALRLALDLELRGRPCKWVFLRQLCRRGVMWFEVMTEGGGVAGDGWW